MEDEAAQAVVVKGWRGKNFNKDVGLTDNKSATALLLSVLAVEKKNRATV